MVWYPGSYGMTSWQSIVRDLHGQGSLELQEVIESGDMRICHRFFRGKYLDRLLILPERMDILKVHKRGMVQEGAAV